MSLDQHIYGSTDWHLPSPTSPKFAAFADSTLKTPRTETFSQSHFIDAWATPVRTPSLILSTPIDRPSTSHSAKVHTPEDPEFHVNHFVPNNLPLPPVEPARRLSSSPGPHSLKQAGISLHENHTYQPRPLSMDTSQMQTPPPTRHASSRRNVQQSGGHDFSTPATVIRRTPVQMPPADGLFNQTPFGGFSSLQFSPDILQFPNAGPLSAPPHSRLFWDQSGDGTQMDVDMPFGADPFGPTPHKIEQSLNWSAFHAPDANNQMNLQAFQALHGMPSPGPMTAFASNASNTSRPNSFVSPSGGVDPSMLFSFSNPAPAASFDHSLQFPPKQAENSRQPYETQLRDSMREMDSSKKVKSQHSRTNTSSSNASVESPKPALQRSNTDSGFRKSRPSSIESRRSGTAPSFNIPRRSSPLKRQSGGALLAIPELRRPKTRLVIDETGRARTEPVPFDDDNMMGAELRKDFVPASQKDLRRQYPGLWTDDDSDTDEEEPPVTLSRNTSFNMPERRPSKHARADSSELQRSNSFKVPRSSSSSRPSSGVFDKSSFETVRPVRRVADNAHRRFSMMDFPTSFDEIKENNDQAMPDSPGDALGALKKVVEGRQKRTDRTAQSTLRAHNQRWAQASADMANATSHDPFINSPSNTADTGLTTPSTDRSSLSGDSTRCVCNNSDDGRPMVQCESCNKWLHMSCVGLSQTNLPPVYVCVFCTGSTPIARGGRVRGPMPLESPLTHKSAFRR